jgi:hypothetical protein
MTAQKREGVQSRHSSVLIRADIFARAQEEGRNISHECNRALADLMGIDYQQQQIPEETITGPVIIASEQASPRSPAGEQPGKKVPGPVMNADDPGTPVHVLKQKKERVVRPSATEPDTAPSQAHTRDDISGAQVHGIPAARGMREKAKKGAAVGKKQPENAIKRFVHARLVRTEGGSGSDNRIAKDDMYQLFVRWCRANSITPVPDRRSFGVALKTRFVMQDSSANGMPCWIDVKLR